MNDAILKYLESAAIKLVDNIYLIDIFGDKIIKYGYENESLVEKEKNDFTNYLETVKSNIKEEYLKDYMNSISIPKLEENNISGNNSYTFTYQKTDNKTYSNTNLLIDINGNKCILVLNRLLESNSEINHNDPRYNSLIEVLADSILKIHNVFNLDEKALYNPKNVSEYIDSIFSMLTSNFPDLKKSFNDKALYVSGRKEDSILIVDDDAITRGMIKKIFDGEYKIVTASNGKEAIEYLDSNEKKGMSDASDHVLGIFLDLTMPVLDGFAVLDYLSNKGYLNKLPVIIISGDYEKETKTRVYSYNIADMLEKPFDFEVVKHRISNFINLYKSSNSLNNLINNQNENLKDIIDAYVKSYYYDYKDSTDIISKYVKILATKVMEEYENYNLSTIKIDKIKDACLYYDIGFYSLPRKVLTKNGDFTSSDVQIIKNYPVFSSKVVDYILDDTNDQEYKLIAKNICKYYHENYDGTGYPNNLKGNLIPIEAQIVGLCVSYYNLKNKQVDAKSIILSNSGSMFNPNIVDCFSKVCDEFDK